MIIDANLYWFDESIFENEKLLEQFLNEIPKQYGIYGYVKNQLNGKKQIVIEKPKGCQNLNYLQGEYQLERIIADLDNAHIDQAIMKVPGCLEWMSLDMCKRFNQGMYRYYKESNGRLIPLAVVPPIASQDVFEEIDHCINDYGFKGVQLSAHYGDKYLDDEIFESFFDKLDSLHTTVYVHHTPLPVEYNDLLDYDNLRRSYGRCVDQMIAVCREIFSDFFEKHIHLKFVHSMLGGGFFTYVNMLMPQSSKKDTVSRFNMDHHLAKKHLDENIYFEMSHSQPWGKEQLECAIKVLGSSNIIWGSSYPVREEWLSQGPDFVQNLDLDEKQKQDILSLTAKKVYGID